MTIEEILELIRKELSTRIAMPLYSSRPSAVSRKDWETAVQSLTTINEVEIIVITTDAQGRVPMIVSVEQLSP